MKHQPAFTVGITGFMTLHPEDQVVARAAIANIFDWLTKRESDGQIQGIESLGLPMGLSASSVVLLSSLAPGVDQIAANIACQRGIDVKAPLPLPHPLYRDSSIFRHGDKADAQRQTDYDAIVDKVGVENLFVVERPEDLKLDASARQELLRNDINDGVRSKDRYRAAGEFIATHCDLLIAVCDRVSPDEKPEINEGLATDAQYGATFVVEACLFGATPEMLPMQSSLTWSDNAPVVRVFVRNMERSPLENVPSYGDVAIWHPIDSCPVSATNEEWHMLQMDSLRDLASRVEDINQQFAAITNVDANEETAALLTMTPPKAFVPTTLLQRLLKRVLHRATNQKPLSVDVASEKLKALATLRRKAAKVNRAADVRIKALINRFIVIAAATVILLQLCEYWIPAPIEQQNLASLINSTRAGFFIVAIGMVALSWVLLRRARKAKYDELQNDFRAIAEALRVQFFWTACGTGESVENRYLQRQKNELSWIRAVVSSVSIPFDIDRKEFAELNIHEKLDRLRRIHHGWIGEQLLYFQKATFELRQRKHWYHFIANIFLVAGIFMTLVGIAAQLLSLEIFIERCSQAWGFFALPQVFMAIIVLFILNELIAWKAWQPSRQTSPNKNGLESQVDPLTEKTFWRHLLRCSEKTSNSPSTVFILGILIGAASVSTIFGCQWDTLYPATIKMNAILKNCYLAVAGLLYSRAAFQFLSQNVRRYSTMVGLYRGADNRMRDLLKALETQAGQETMQAEQQKTIRAIQSLLVNLGIEALNENSEWLQMHRTTPIAPLMPVA